LEYDLAAGGRGNRETYVERLLTRLTGAEAAFVVNNNAGAVLLLLMALAGGREVLVSRGQLVEIGGSFRLPDIMRAGGVRLVEVGTTNRTRLEDFENAIGPETAMLLRVHTSNYRVVGFTEEPELGSLVELGQRRGVVVADDLGSGALAQLDVFRDEPTVAGSLRTGVDVVCFSGDKLLGGPQAGILVGKAEVIAGLRKHPVARALRLDKMSLAALEATLSLYLDSDRARAEIPTLRFLSRGPAETLSLASRLQAAIEDQSADGLILEVEESVARAGGGSLPLAEFPSHAVRIRLPEAPAPTVSLLDAELRRAPLPVVARVAQDSLHLDVMALEESDLESVAGSVVWAIRRLVEGADVGRAGTASTAG
jgi:L-seryl-tRNA(Ser) seleniumtransferase